MIVNTKTYRLATDTVQCYTYVGVCTLSKGHWKLSALLRINANRSLEIMVLGLAKENATIWLDQTHYFAAGYYSSWIISIFLMYNACHILQIS